MTGRDLVLNRKKLKSMIDLVDFFNSNWDYSPRRVMVMLLIL